jgi:cobalt-precorrin 5A hydrolase
MSTEFAMTTAQQRSISCIVITHAGLRVARCLQAALDARVNIYASSRVVQRMQMEEREAEQQAGLHIVENVTDALHQCWHVSDQLILCLALGAVIRLIAPFLQDKYLDPGVVVIDDAATFVISVLSGHAGGANTLAHDAAYILHALPVVTTASDVHVTLAIDQLGRDQHWWLEPSSDLTGVAAAIVNGEPVVILQEAGASAWWGQHSERNSNLTYTADRQLHIARGSFAAQVLITDRMVEDLLVQDKPTVLYRPATLVLGIGCRRGVAFGDLESFVYTALQVRGLSIKSVATLATADIKGDEPAILELVQRYGWTLDTHTVEELRAVKDIPSPSERVLHLIGTSSVSEASALLSSAYGELVVHKQKGVGMTIAVARIRGFEDHSGVGNER